MESLIPWRSGPLPEAGSQEPQIECAEAPEDELDHTEPELAELRFQFIGETGYSRPRGATRRLVRSQASRDVSNRKQNRKQNALSKHAPRLLHPHNKSNRSREPSKSTVPGLLVAPAGHKIDPFDTLPVDGRGNTQYLISKCKLPAALSLSASAIDINTKNQVVYTIFYPTDRPYSPVRPTFEEGESHKAVLSDSAMLHVTLAHVAMGLSSLPSIELGPDVIYHIGQAIAIVNKRISNFHHEPIMHKDKTIMTVTILTHFEIRAGSPASARMHLDGLAALVKSRGGMKTLASDLFTTRHTYWVDIVGTIILGSKPYYALDLDNPAPYPDLQDLEPCNLTGKTYQTKLSNFTGLQDLSQETTKVYRLLRHLITEKERVAGLRSMGITEAEFQSLQLYSFRIMYRLIALAQYKIPDSPNRNALVYGLFGNAGLVHILMFTCNSPLRIGDTKLISARIRTSLEMINITAFQIAYPDMMLWIIMIGGLASTGTEDTKWFIERLAELCRAAGIATIAELALSLTGFLWSEFYLICPLFNEFWDDLRKEICEGV